MASGGSSRRPTSSESRSFDFGSDELLFSYDDYTQQKDQTANAKRSDSTTKDLHENRIGRPLANVYGQQNEFPREDVLSAVEICMKKHADNLMRNLDEINGRLTQLELFCYKLERTVGEFQTDIIHGQSEADMKLKSLEKHVHEIHRSVQIIRDKQDLAEAHKELTKLHLSQNETVNSTTPSHRNNEDAAAAKSAINGPQNDNSDMSNLQLTLALPNQTSPDQNPPVQDRYIQNHSTAYYAPNLPHHAPPPQPPPFHQHQQHQWPQPMPHRQPPPPTYPPYLPYQPSIAESFQTGGMPPPPPYSAAAPQSIGYGVAGIQSSRIGANPFLPQPNMRPAYNSAFAIDGTRAAHPQSYMPASPVMRNHPYGEVIEKAASMGYSRDHVVNVVKMMEETGQPLDFNSVLDELNVHANGGAPRAWSR